MTDTATLKQPRTRNMEPGDTLSVAREALDVARCTSDKIDQVLAILGCETEDGRGGYDATGMMGRLRRVETQSLRLVRSYEGWFRTAGGFGAAVILIGGVVTFLVSNHIVKVG